MEKQKELEGKGAGIRSLLLGYGEIGKGVFESFSWRHPIHIYDPGKNAMDATDNQGIELLLVAIPYNDGFVRTVKDWQARLGITSTLIFSTVPIGTCRELGACHYPIEAKHPYIARDMGLHDGFFGGTDEKCLDFLVVAGKRPTIMGKPEYTEFLKLRSTAIYGVNLEFARYSAKVAKQIGMDPSFLKTYDEQHNNLVIKRKTPEHIRYLLDPPVGMIGGHCVVPNAIILNKQFPSPFLAEIITTTGKGDDIDE